MDSQGGSPDMSDVALINEINLEKVNFIFSSQLKCTRLSSSVNKELSLDLSTIIMNTDLSMLF